MSMGELDLDVIDSVEDNYKIINLVVSKFKLLYPSLTHTKTKTYDDKTNGKIVKLTFVGVGRMKCLSCSCEHLLDENGVVCYYSIDKKIVYMLCPAGNIRPNSLGERRINKSYIVYSENDHDGPIVENEGSKILYNWLINEEKITINRKSKGNGIYATPLFERFKEYCKKNNIFPGLSRTKFGRLMYDVVGFRCSSHNSARTEMIYLYLYY